jgi:hypothetical protein
MSTHCQSRRVWRARHLQAMAGLCLLMGARVVTAQPAAAPPAAQAAPDVPDRTLPVALESMELIEADVPAVPVAVVVDTPSATQRGALPVDQALRAWLSLGAGLGDRIVHLPTRNGPRRLNTGGFPALDVAIGLDAPLRRRWRLGAALHYQTSVGLRASEAPLPGAALEQTPLRSHHIDFGLSPGYRFGRTQADVTLRAYVGWGIRGLRSVVDIAVPNFTLQGPLLRPELTIPLAHGALVLRFAPELLVIVSVSGSLRNAAAAATTGVAWGGEASVGVRLFEPVQLVVAYRESHAVLKALSSATVADIERFATAALVLTY